MRPRLGTLFRKGLKAVGSSCPTLARYCLPTIHRYEVTELHAPLNSCIGVSRENFSNFSLQAG